MACTNPNTLHRLRRDHSVIIFNYPSKAEEFLWEKFEVPCWQCLDCRVGRARDWSTRIMHEASMHEYNCVVTLTYDDEHLPNRGMLRYSDVQKFIRRLRDMYPDLNLSYVCGCEYGKDEYGRPGHGRPHYHLILLGFDPEDKKHWKQAGNDSKLFTSDIILDLWKLGHILVGELTRESADYVARYCVEKRTGEAAKEWYARQTHPDLGPVYKYSVPPECIRVSKGRAKPGEHLPFGRGIGARWLERFWSDVFPADHVVMRGGVELKPPRYYDKLLKRRDADGFEAVRAKREAEALTPRRQAEETPERRSVRAVCTRARSALKKREL